MKKLIVIAGCAAVALTGCASRRVADVEEGDIPCMPGVMSLEARHAHLKSILGIDDAALTDTNRFVLGVGDYSQVFRLDKPVMLNVVNLLAPQLSIVRRSQY